MQIYLYFYLVGKDGKPVFVGAPERQLVWKTNWAERLAEIFHLRPACGAGQGDAFAIFVTSREGPKLPPFPDKVDDPLIAEIADTWQRRSIAIPIVLANEEPPAKPELKTVVLTRQMGCVELQYKSGNRSFDLDGHWNGKVIISENSAREVP